MKLLYCKACEDMFKLTPKEKRCKCRSTRGAYDADRWHAWFSGPYATTLGIAWPSFLEAVEDPPEPGAPMGKRFEAFVIAEKCPTFRRKP